MDQLCEGIFGTVRFLVELPADPRAENSIGFHREDRVHHRGGRGSQTLSRKEDPGMGFSTVESVPRSCGIKSNLFRGCQLIPGDTRD